MKKHFNLLYLMSAIIIALSACSKEEKITPAKTYRSEILLAPFPKSSVAGQETGGKIVILDHMGNTIKSKDLSTAAFDFKRWIIDGKVRYSYNEFDATAYRIPDIGHIPATAVVLDEDLNELQRIRLLPHNGRTGSEPTDGHEFLLLGENHYIVTSYQEKVVDNIPDSLTPVPENKIVAPVVQEVKDGQVIFEWDGSDYAETYGNSVEWFDPGAPRPADYAHLNSVFVDPKDNNLILSFRNMDQVIKVNRQTGNIMWRLGSRNSDFDLTDNQVFLRQHNATINEEGNLMIFDNGHRKLRPYTRIVEFKLDEVSKTVVDFHAKKINNMFFEFMGSVQKTGDSYFIACGTENLGSEVNLIEMNANTGEITFEKSFVGDTYRAYKY